MNTRFTSALILSAGLLALGALAQTPAPAPTVEAAAVPAVGRIVYAPRLPAANELMSVAAAQGLGVERIDQTATQIVVTYKSAAGQLSTVAYQLLPAAAPTAAPADATVFTPTPAPTVTYVAAAPARTVVYAQPYTYAQTYAYAQPYPYAYYDPFYYPWGYYSPVSVSLGFGFYGGHGYYGGHGNYGGHGGHGPHH